MLQQHLLPGCLAWPCLAANSAAAPSSLPLLLLSFHAPQGTGWGSWWIVSCPRVGGRRPSRVRDALIAGAASGLRLDTSARLQAPWSQTQQLLIVRHGRG